MSPIISGGGGGGGGSQPNAVLTHRIPFAFNTAGLVTGASLFVPTIGDFLLDLWIEITTAWNGTTPFLDIGTFDPRTDGLFSNWAGAALPMDTGADFGPSDMSCLAKARVLSSLRDLIAITMPTSFNDSIYAVAGAAVNLVADPPAEGNRILPAKFISATPIKVCVSQTGATNGASPGSSQGAGALCLVTSTPASS